MTSGCTQHPAVRARARNPAQPREVDVVVHSDRPETVVRAGRMVKSMTEHNSEAPAGVADDASDGPEATTVEAQQGPDATAADAVKDDAVSGRAAELEHEGEIAADYLETLLDIADLDGDLEVDVEGDRAAVSIVDSEEGRVPRRLVGEDGKVLEALQELARLAVQAETGERTRLMLDVASHRADRRSELEALAASVVSSVQESGEKENLEPMSAFERKVVHDAVLAAGLRSESEGTEPRRYVVVLPA